MSQIILDDTTYPSTITASSETTAHIERVIPLAIPILSKTSSISPQLTKYISKVISIFRPTKITITPKDPTLNTMQPELQQTAIEDLSEFGTQLAGFPFSFAVPLVTANDICSFFTASIHSYAIKRGKYIHEVSYIISVDLLSTTYTIYACSESLYERIPAINELFTYISQVSIMDILTNQSNITSLLNSAAKFVDPPLPSKVDPIAIFTIDFSNYLTITQSTE